MNFYIMDLSEIKRDISELTDILYIDDHGMNSLFSDLLHLTSDVKNADDNLKRYVYEYIRERGNRLDELITIQDKAPRVAYLLNKIGRSIIDLLNTYHLYRSGRHFIECVQLYGNNALLIKDTDIGNQTTGT